MAFINPESVLAIDFGEKRVGVAVATLAVRLPRPLTTMSNNDSLIVALKQVIEVENVTNLVVGYPRGLEGQSTDQTRVVEEFVKQLKLRFNIPIDLQDEALTSQKAEEELARRERPYKRGDIDALAAAYILDDWLKEHPKYE